VRLGTPCQLCLLYHSLAHAAACKSFLCSPRKGENVLNAEEIKIKAIDFESKLSGSNHRGKTNVSIVRLYAIFFPVNMMSSSMVFWRLTGTGISSRLADNLLEHVERLREAPLTGTELIDKSTVSAGMIAMDIICQRIADLLERSPVGSPRPEKVSKSDVFLYPTGMSAIYHCHQLLLSWRGTESIIFGFPYELTLKMLQTYGPACKFYGFGTSRELDHLEEYLQSEMENGRFVQAIWCECSSNPLLRTVDLNRIRGLADKYEFVLVVDETIGSFANVDVLGVADIVITSLTKSFSGFLDVMAGR
jgi:cystathionine gamma-synthase